MLLELKNFIIYKRQYASKNSALGDIRRKVIFYVSVSLGSIPRGHRSLNNGIYLRAPPSY